MLSFGKKNKDRWNVFHEPVHVHVHSWLHLGFLARGFSFCFFFHMMRIKCSAPRLFHPSPAFSINNKRVNAVASQSSCNRRPYFNQRYTVGTDSASRCVYVCVREFVYLRESSHQRTFCYSLLGAMSPNTATWWEGKKKKAERCHFNLHSVYHVEKILVQVETMTGGNPPRFKAWIERTRRIESFLESQNRIIQSTVLELLGISQWVALLALSICCSHVVTLTTIFCKLKTL